LDYCNNSTGFMALRLSKLIYNGRIYSHLTDTCNYSCIGQVNSGKKSYKLKNYRIKGTINNLKNQHVKIMTGFFYAYKIFSLC
jgi:hypothetical protein